MRLPILSAVISALCATATAQITYYADPVGGSDLNPGTSSATAVRSISYAVTLLTDDDTLILLPGTFSPSLTGEIFPIPIGNAGSQLRVTIRAEEGPNATILDGEQQASGAGTPLMRFYAGAEGSRVLGLQFLNATAPTPDYWSMAIRLGSTSGGAFEAKDIEIAGCIFRNGYRGIVIFGSNGSSSGTTTTGCRIHDNLFENNAHRSIAAWGDGVNHIYNNTFVDGGYEAVYADSLGSGSTQGPSNARVTNNIAVNCSNVGNLGGFAYGATAATNNAVFDANLGFNNGGGDFVGGTFPPSNVTADPMFVGVGDYHLQAGSPAIETGSNAILPLARVDFDGFSRAHDSNNDNLAAIDRGAFEYTQYGMSITGTWGPGGSLTFHFAAPTPGGGSVIFGFDDGAFPLLPFGIFGIAPNAIIVAVPLSPSPGSGTMNVPNNPNLSGARLVLQGVHLGPPIHLLHVVDHTL